MVDFNTLNPKWDNSRIKEQFGIGDDAVNCEDKFYYITSENKLAYLEAKADNSANTIAKVLYTLGLLESNRVAKDAIACGIICNGKHLSRLQESAMKDEAKTVLKDDICDLLQEIADKIDALRNLM